MDKGKQKYESFDDDDDEDFSGSDGDLSVGSSGTSSSSNKEDLVIDKAFLKWIAPGGSADQAGFMKGDEVISVNNSTVHGRRVTDIDELLKRSNAVDVNVVVDPSKRKYKKYVGNGYDLYLHQDSRDDSSDQESLENDNHLTTTGSDRYFFITRAKKSESSKNRSRLHQFLRPTSYCDDEPLMESKPVCMSKDNSNECNWNLQNVDDISKGNKMIWKSQN
ncbi:uncharacterized protein LOC124440779 isoform X2 [Xenia sp. Carnegie-2017]|nr:uncharacterized protein LOC124440779 isoform X2 [Xenia sp. Carnegie-2017]